MATELRRADPRRENIPSRVFGPDGFFFGLRLAEKELKRVRDLITARWLSRIAAIAPEQVKAFADRGIQHYHELAHLIPHKSLWGYDGRNLPGEAVAEISQMSIFQRLESDFGPFTLSKLRESETHGQINLRVVRPHVSADVGPLHADKWFWDLGNGVDMPGKTRVKVWIAVHCESGLNGLKLIPGSHRRDGGTVQFIRMASPGRRSRKMWRL